MNGQEPDAFARGSLRRDDGGRRRVRLSGCERAPAWRRHAEDFESRYDASEFEGAECALGDLSHNAVQG